MDYSHAQQEGKGVLIPLSQAQTPRPSEKASTDGYLTNNPDEGVNIQVIIRCRPLSKNETGEQTPIVISCDEHRREVSAILNVANKQIYRTFTFDKVFGPTSMQKEFYDQAISPLINEVIEGYNCTIFAYGQTGTGKTYTMQGGVRAEEQAFQNDGGVIPRAVQQIFNILEAQNADYSMKVTFLELYNEEITDLLATDDCPTVLDNKSKRPIVLLEDGKRSVFVRGLEEEIVSSANEIYRILEKGSAKRRTADTLLTKDSSRSHSILSITIHTRESAPEGQEFVRSGKLNLVDLAGSENIVRSGAREVRAREVGEINKSLLTLGRVINALFENSGHVPYRDSKLTRLLRDSLGGKTKTCIIATISPSIHSLEETLSTLDYAHRAKNIKNKPEVNQKIIKSTLIKDLYAQIEHLKREVNAAREKNGIYIPQDHYLHEEAERKAMAKKIEYMEHHSAIKNKQMRELQELYNYQHRLTAELRRKLERTQNKYEQTEQAFIDLEDSYRLANATIKEKEHMIFHLLSSEKELTERASELEAERENAVSELSHMFAKIERKNEIEDGNKMLLQNFQVQLTQQLEILHKSMGTCITQLEQQLKGMDENADFLLSTKEMATEQLKTQLVHLNDSYGLGIKSFNELAKELYENSQLACGNFGSEISQHSSSLADILKSISFETDSSINDLQCILHNQRENIAAYALQHQESHSRRLQTTHFISKIAVDFFKTISMQVSNLTQIIEEAQVTSEQKLCELEKKFEEHAAYEERQLLEKVAELLASSNAKKKTLLLTAVHSLRENTASRTRKLKQEMLDMQDFTSSFNDEWTNCLNEMKTHYLNDSTTEKSEKSCLEEGLQHCMSKAKLCATQWRNAQELLLSLQERCIDFANSILKGDMKANEAIHSRLSSAASSALGEADAANKIILSSIEYLLKLDHDARGNIKSLIAPSCEEMEGIKRTHCQKILEITELVEKRLIEEYMVDKLSCSTPRSRPFNALTTGSVGKLKPLASE